MKAYTNVVQWGNRILVRGVDGNKRIKAEIPFKPSLYVKSQDESDYHSLYGDSLKRIDFGDINDAKEFVKKYCEVSNFPIYGNTNYAYQYISEEYTDEIEYDIHKLSIQTIDIETTSRMGFPDIDDPQEEVLLISMQDYSTKEIRTYHWKEYTGKEKVNLILCQSEHDMLSRFVDDMHTNSPDVITGWNIDFFDIPYLYNRIAKIFGQATAKKLSPWGIVREKETHRMGRASKHYELLGVSILDYLDLYKKFTYHAQESYTLDHIAYVELNEHKKPNPYNTHEEFYTNDYNGYVDYNIHDVRLVDRLESKMKLIDLIITMAYGAKSNYNDVFSPVKTWDCIIYNHMLKKKMIVNQRSENRNTGQIAGGFVKEPIPGEYKWVVSFDATSLYPSIIMAWNMSPETLDDSIFVSASAEDYIDKKVPLKSTKYLAAAANGHFFRHGKQGLFPEIVEMLFEDRQLYKRKMLSAQKEYQETKNTKLLNDISAYDNRQMARKIQLNSLFGALANEHFRHFDNRIAEGITLTGQLIVQFVAKRVNSYLNKICGTTDYDYTFYADTDSVYITLDPIVKKFMGNRSKERIITMIDKVCKDQLSKVFKDACKELLEYTNAYDAKVEFKREAIADKGIWVAKKRYALNVYDNEGVVYKEPKLKVMGLEIVRSSTPEEVRGALREAVKLALTENEDALQKFVKEFEKKFRALPPELIAFPRSVNGMLKYKDPREVYSKGTPMHVRGALMYNYILEKSDSVTRKKYNEIREGEKIKFLYLKEPNEIRENCIAFLSELPVEFNLHRYVDYETMFSKTFLEPIESIIKYIGWNAAPVASLESLFE